VNRPFIAIVVSIVIVGAGISLWRTLRPISDRFDPTTSLAVGQVLAEETAKAIQNKGQVVAVLSKHHQEPVGAAHAEWQAFRDELKKHPGIALTATEAPPDPEGLPGLSPAAFKEILERHSQVAAIVFFEPLPSWRRMEGALPPPPTARVIALGLPLLSPKNEFTGYFTQNLLAVLLCRQLNRGPNYVNTSPTPRERFHNEYQIITPQNYETLPE